MDLPVAASRVSAHQEEQKQMLSESNTVTVHCSNRAMHVNDYYYFNFGTIILMQLSEAYQHTRVEHHCISPVSMIMNSKLSDPEILLSL